MLVYIRMVKRHAMLADDDDKRAIGRERTRLSKSSFGMYIIVVVIFLAVSFSRVSGISALVDDR